MSSKKILFVITNHGEFANSGGKPTGWYLPEVAHPYNYLFGKGYEIVISSPKGGSTPLDPDSAAAFKDDPECISFLADKTAMSAMDNSVQLSTLDAKDFAAIFFAGGHGPMYDLPENPQVHSITAAIYEKGGVVAAVCHGPAGIVNVKLSNGDFLVKGKKVTSFTNSEEDAVDKTKYMPFSLEDQLKDNGGIISNKGDWAENVIVDGRVITGQNPASAGPLAKALDQALGGN